MDGTTPNLKSCRQMPADGSAGLGSQTCLRQVEQADLNRRSRFGCLKAKISICAVAGFRITLTMLIVWLTGCRAPVTGTSAATNFPSQGAFTEVPTVLTESPAVLTETSAAPTQAIPTAPLKSTAAQTETLPQATLTETPSELAAIFQGLSLDEFYNASWRVLTLRHPETVLAEGLTAIYGVSTVSLDDISDAYQQETYALAAAILDTLHSYDRAALTPEEAISYDIYEWYLQDFLAGNEFMYHDYPATYDDNTAIHRQLILFFTDLHPLTNLQEARDYITRLNQVDRKIEQQLEGLRLREAAGIRPPQFAVQWEVYGRLPEWINSPAVQTPFYTAFEVKVNALSGVSSEQRQALLADAGKAIMEVVLPAYKQLRDFLAEMPTYAGEDSGVGRLPEGKAYYAYLLHHYNSTDFTADQIYELGGQELERIHAAMRLIFDKLGYPQEENLAQLFDRVGRDGGHVAGNDVLTTYEKLVEEASQNVEAVFDIRPRAEIVVIPDEYGGFYISASRDGSRPGAFYAGVGGQGEQYYAMPTLAYHEAIPGHHFQISIAHELQDAPAFRTADLFTAYIEGWALYAEQLAWELGWYENDPYGELGFLQAQAFRAARLVVDTGIHARGWTFEQAQQFFTENTGFDMQDTINPRLQIARYIVWPGQATSYYIGYLKILELRQRAKDQLGDLFNLAEFHHVVLSNGGMPLEILERVVDNYIAERQKR